LLLTGQVHEDAMRKTLVDAGAILARVRPFLERMELAYAIADLVVSRAGATTCAEVTVCGVPAVLVPYPHATGGHQEANARALERAGAAIVVMDEEMSGTRLAATIEALLSDPGRLDSMGERARAWSRPDAAQALASVVMGAGGAR